MDDNRHELENTEIVTFEPDDLVVHTAFTGIADSEGMTQVDPPSLQLP